MDNINWYPGHMAKATKLIEESLRQVDLVVELCDARIPESSRNPVLARLVQKMPHILFMNKSDLADPVATEAWVEAYRRQGLTALPGSALDRKDRAALIETAERLLDDKLQRQAERGIKNTTFRLMMIGIPNSGKSTLINALAGRKAAAAEDRPGVTRGAQWVRTDKGYDLLDMPGVLWPQLGDRRKKLNLACTGAIRDRVLDLETVAYGAVELLLALYPEDLIERFRLTSAEGDPYDLYLEAARRRGCVRSGGKIDEHRFAVLFLDELRGGKIARITLERPEAAEEGGEE